MMKKKGKKKTIIRSAIALALVVVFTVGFLAGPHLAIFGALNKNEAKSPNPYVDESSAQSLSVAFRGEAGESSANIVVSNQGGNGRGTDPEANYTSWKATIKDEDGNDETIEIPGTEGAKGSEKNPFVVVEVVPEKAMQEMTYYVGSDTNAGLPFDMGYLTATFMEQLRKDNETKTVSVKKSKISETDCQKFDEGKINAAQFFGRINSAPSQFDDGSSITSAIKNNTDAWAAVYKEELETGAGITGGYVYYLGEGKGDYKLDGNLYWNPVLAKCEGGGYGYTKNLSSIPDMTKCDAIWKFGNSEYVNYYMPVEEFSGGVNEGEYVGKYNFTVNLSSTNTYRLTDKNYNGKDSADGFYKQVVIERLKDIFGKWTVDDDYESWRYGDVTEDGERETGIKLFDCRDTGDTSDKKGSLDFYELYNLDITTDDLLNIYPSTWEKNGDYGYQEKRSEGGYKDFSDLYYTDDLICLVKRVTGDETPTKEDVESFIMNTLMSSENRLNYRILMSSNTPAGVKKEDTATARNNDVIKYNLKDYVQAQWVWDGDAQLKKQGKFAQDVTNSDLVNSGEFETYDISEGYIGRGINAAQNTLHKTLNISNYWKVRFRKYYVDRFEELFNKYEELDTPLHEMEKNGTDTKIVTSLLLQRNTALRDLLREYEPLFTRKGVNVKALEDTYDWETRSKTVASTERSYQAQNKGGYVLAVKPGMGDMYLLSNKELKKILANMTAKERTESGVDENSIIFTRDDTDADGKKRDEKEKRWVFVQSKFTLNGDSRASLNNSYRSGYLDDDQYTLGFSSKSFTSKNAYWLAIYDRKNRKFHGTDGNRNDVGNDWGRQKRLGYDQFSYKMLEKTNSLSEKENYDKVHNTAKEDNYFDFDGQRFYDSRDEEIYFDWQRRGEQESNGRYAVDDYHLNAYDEIAKLIGADKMASLVKKKNNLSDTDYISGDFLFENSGSDRLTGFTFNFNASDTYDYSTAGQGSADKAWRQQWRYVPVEGKGDKGGKDSDRVDAVSKSQVVCETGKKYSFTYYGFKANPILQKALFRFEDEKDFESFNFKVICVTPAEMNQIAAQAAQANSGKVGVSSDIRLDLAERADLYYFHTQRTKTIFEQDNFEMAYQFYKDVVLQGKKTKAISDFNTFFDNDLEWSQVMKILKRSSDPDYGPNLPIMYNNLVSDMSEECVDENEKLISRNAEDTHMYLEDTGEKNMNSFHYSGNVCNLSKMYIITIQFNLRQSKSKEVERTFMDDIYPYLYSVDINKSYKATPRNRVAYTAEKTGYIKAVGDSGAGYKRALCPKGDRNEQFERNTLSLWNRYTFYPAGIKLGLNNDLKEFLAQGYLQSYYAGFREGGESIFSGDNDRAFLTRYGTDGLGIDGMFSEDGDQNIYVLHEPNDLTNEHTVSFFSSIGQKGTHINDFLKVAFNIMNNQSPKSVKINAEKRNKVYSLLNDIDVDTDLVLFDVDKHVNYKAAQLEKERNIYVYVKNYYNRVACIKDIKLVDSTGTKTKDISSILVQKGDSLETKHKETCVGDASEGKSAPGFKVETKAQMYFYIPYTYKDFLGKNAGDSTEYNKIVIEGVGWNWKDRKSGEKTKEYTFRREIEIEDQGLFLLE